MIEYIHSYINYKNEVQSVQGCTKQFVKKD